MEKTLFTGTNLIQLASIDSTNNYAKQLLANSKPIEGTVIMAHEQLAGRGQMGNIWQSEAGKNLTLSLIMYPNFLEASKQFYLSMAVSLAVKDFCEEVLKDEIKIKWPNDIYYRNKKLGGILIENTISGSNLASTVIGIGLNINQLQFNPALPNPTSFAQVRNDNYDILSLIEPLCVYIEKYYLQLRQLHFNFLEKGYTQALYRFQQTHEFKKGEQIIRGEIDGVTKDGKLIVQSGSKTYRFAFKEVEYVL